MTVEGAGDADLSRGEVLDPDLSLPGLPTGWKCSEASGHGHERSGLLSSESRALQEPLLTLAHTSGIPAYNPKLGVWDGRNSNSGLPHSKV